MELNERLSLFEKEINYIESENIKEFVRDILGKLPDYFFEIPASSTGKYHPSYALGEQGLVRHTKAAVGIACELFTILKNYTSDERDCCIAALILHDGCKNGRNGTKNSYTAFNHPLEVVDLIKENYKAPNTPYEIEICDLISSHMGQWNKDLRTGTTLPLPISKTQRFVHMCDYLASRKCLEFNFNTFVDKRW